MNRCELTNRAQAHLSEAIERLSKMTYAELATWPEWPESPNIDLGIPAELSEYRFTVMKDTQPDKRIRIAIQLSRHRFLGIGQMTANGFFVSPDGAVERFTERDLWEVT